MHQGQYILVLIIGELIIVTFVLIMSFLSLKESKKKHH